MSGATRTASPRSFPPDEASSWRRIRRYAVPRWMIEQATERRLAGDWRGACAAARIDLAFDLADVARDQGPAVATALEDDLRHLAPDLLRWHLPRILHGRTTIATNHAVILSRYDRPEPGLPAISPGHGRGPMLHVCTPSMVEGPQRLTLEFGGVRPRGDAYGNRAGRQIWTGARHLWDARHSDELRRRCGGTDRVPFFRADGTALAEHEVPVSAPSRREDLAAHTEWVTRLCEQGRIAEAFSAAGIELDPTPVELPYRNTVLPLEVLKEKPLAVAGLALEVRRLSETWGGTRFFVRLNWHAAMLLEVREPEVSVRFVISDEIENDEALPEASWRRLPDHDLLRDGRIDPDELHPLVRTALFPRRPAPERPAGPPDAEPPAPVRVRCLGEWHEVSCRQSAFSIPHDEQEQQRERAMRAFGGAIAGCFAAQQALIDGIGRPPRALRDQRREIFNRVQHGDTPGVLLLLDAGMDPRLRDGRKRTLLHRLHLLDHELLLPRLLAAGLDLEARDNHHRTPLHVAVGDLGSESLVRALLSAGAHTDVVDDMGMSLRDMIRRRKRRELHFLAEQIAHDHPDLHDHPMMEDDE